MPNMSMIEATLEANPDGTVHLPLPPGMRQGLLRITAQVEPVESTENTPPRETRGGFGCLKGKIQLAPDFDAPLDDFQDYMG